MELPLLAWSVELKEDRLMILDESRLPDETDYLTVRNYHEAARAISEMKTRAFGQLLTFYYAVLMTARVNSGQDPDVLCRRIREATLTLENSRPTFAFKDFRCQVLHWAEAARERASDISLFLEQKIFSLLEGIKELRLKRAQLASTLIETGSALLTHCNTSGELVLIGRACRDAGKQVGFYATETRPYFQGRLTSWELAQDGFDVTLVTDNAVGSLLAKRKCQLVMVGSDRVALNGDVINKVGTLQLAIAAKTFNVPFYVLVQEPGSCAAGKEIAIEQRDSRELLCYKGKKIYPEKVAGYYPAFDLTLARYITRLITFGGIVDPLELPQGWQRIGQRMRKGGQGKVERT